MLEEVAPTCKSPPCVGFEPGSKAARSAREDSLSFEEVLERKKKATRAAHEQPDAAAAAVAQQPAPPPPPPVEQKPPAVEGEDEGPIAGTQAVGTTPAGGVCPPAGTTQAADGDEALTGGQDANCPVVPAVDRKAADLQAASASLTASTAAAGDAVPVDPAIVEQGIDAMLTAAQNLAAGAVETETVEIQKAVAPAPGASSAAAAGAQSAAASIDAAVITPAAGTAVSVDPAAVKPAEARVESYLERAKEVPPQSAAPVDPASQVSVAGQASRPDMAAAAAAQEPARTAEASQDLLQQVAKNIQLATTQNGTTMRLQLHPHELGSIDIRLVSNQNGVGIMVLAEKAATGRLLESQMAQLQQSVLNAGVQVSQLWVGQNPQSDAQASLFPQQRSDQPANGREQNFAGGQKGAAHNGQAKKAARYSLIDYRA